MPLPLSQPPAATLPSSYLPAWHSHLAALQAGQQSVQRLPLACFPPCPHTCCACTTVLQAGLLLALFGGVRKAPGAEGEMALRGDVHILMASQSCLSYACMLCPATAFEAVGSQFISCQAAMVAREPLDRSLRGCVLIRHAHCASSHAQVGDPGLGKSQLLQAAAAAAPRGVYVCGNTSSAAGLTVSVVRENGEVKQGRTPGCW